MKELATRIIAAFLVLTKGPVRRPIRRPVAGALWIDAMLMQPVTTSWVYDPADPLAVQLVCDDGSRWRFARSLLRDGLETMAGEGRVHIRRRGGAAEVTLRGVFGPECRIRFRWDDLVAFVAASERLVPHGTEPVDVDALVRQVMAP